MPFTCGSKSTEKQSLVANPPSWSKLNGSAIQVVEAPGDSGQPRGHYWERVPLQLRGHVSNERYAETIRAVNASLTIQQRLMLVIMVSALGAVGMFFPLPFAAHGSWGVGFVVLLSVAPALLLLLAFACFVNFHLEQYRMDRMLNQANAEYFSQRGVQFRAVWGKGSALLIDVLPYFYLMLPASTDDDAAGTHTAAVGASNWMQGDGDLSALLV